MVEYEGANPVPYHRPYHSALALDRSGQPHTVYGQTSPLKYARWTGAEWQVRIVEWAGQGNGCGLELDASDAPHVVYERQSPYTGSSTRYAYWTGGQWAIHPIAVRTQKAAFDLDSHGRPHIAHVSSISGSMDYARYDGRNWHSQTIDVSRVVEGLAQRLPLDSMGRGHISYTSDDTTAWRVLKYARYDGSRWQTETVPLGSSNPVRFLSSALALDKTGRPHIAYVTEYDLFYAWKDGQTWHTENVGSVSGGYYDKCLLTLDGNDQPHIACGGYDAVRYARRDGTGWHMELVEWYYPMGFASIVVDGQDHPHIVYGTSNTSRGLRHAWHDGAAWHIETIAQDSQVHYVSAVLDSQGRLQVGYEGATTGLGYALYDGTAWHTETVTATSTSHLSLAVDGQDRPHIVYNHHQYAWFDGSAWQFEAAGDPAGEYPALAVDTRGQPHISYYDPIGRDLKYARLVLPSPSLDKQANPMDDVLNCDIVTYTLVISAPGMGIQLWDPLPPNVHYITDSLTNTIAPRAVYSSTARAVMWQGAIPTDTVQTIRFQLTSNITGTMVLSPSLPVVNTAWITDTYSGLGLSDTVIVNGWRVYLIMMMK